MLLFKFAVLIPAVNSFRYYWKARDLDDKKADTGEGEKPAASIDLRGLNRLNRS